MAVHALLLRHTWGSEIGQSEGCSAFVVFIHCQFQAPSNPVKNSLRPSKTAIFTYFINVVFRHEPERATG